MSFFNPYMSKPDYGQGFGDLRNLILQIMTQGKMGGGGGQQQPMPQQGAPMPGGGTNPGAMSMSMPSGQPMGGGMNPGAMSMSRPGGMGQGQMNPQMLMMLIQKLMSSGGGGAI